MRSIVITAAGGAEVLQAQSRPEPECGAGEILVRIKATAVNRADVLQRKGNYPAPPGASPDVPGLEYAGIVKALAADVINFKVGDRVFGLAPGGTYQEYLAVHASTAMHLPAELSWTDGAAIPEAFITAYDAVCLQANLKSGENLLVSAAASGVGIAAAQIARALGARTIGTVRQQTKIDSLKKYFDHVICVQDGQFADQVNALCQGADVVLELVGGDYVSEDLKCTRSLGRIMVVGLLAGAKCNFNLGALLAKRLTLKGTTLRARSIVEKSQVTALFASEILPLFSQGKLRPVIEKIFPIDEAAAAHKMMEADMNFGKIVLDLTFAKSSASE